MSKTDVYFDSLHSLSNRFFCRHVRVAIMNAKPWNFIAVRGGFFIIMATREIWIAEARCWNARVDSTLHAMKRRLASDRFLIVTSIYHMSSPSYSLGICVHLLFCRIKSAIEPIRNPKCGLVYILVGG